jgi:hypothetical protein
VLGAHDVEVVGEVRATPVDPVVVGEDLFDPSDAAGWPLLISEDLGVRQP